MVHDLQKAMIWKRVSAWLFDVILLGILAAGLAFGLSSLLGYDHYSAKMDEAYARYEQEYDTDFSLSPEKLEALPAEQQQNFLDAYEALTSDGEAMHAYSMMISLTLVILSISILLAFLILEFGLPLYFGNGQTLGKKIFGIAVMRTSGLRLNTVTLFIRTVLGKYTIETMVPVLVVLLIFFGSLGFAGTLILLGLLLLQVILMIATRTNSLIHDVLANTVVIDYASQMIFDTEEEMLAYKNRLHEQWAARQSY